MLIGTHNSGTGEPSKGFIYKLVLPFAKTQSKTIKEQYDSGCRYFDLRVKYDGDKLVLAHGLWKSSTTLREVISYLCSKSDWLCTITYEGTLKIDTQKEVFIKTIDTMLYSFGIKRKVIYLAYKTPWTVVKRYRDGVFTEQAFINLTWFNWHCLIPIPWIWNKLCTRKHEFNNSYFKLVDFL